MKENEPNLDDLELPSSLQGEFDNLYQRAEPLPSNLDDSILTTAKAGLSRRMWFRRTVRLSAGLAASAAAVLLAIHLSRITAPAPAPVVAAMPGDIDHNGKVNILDAYLLARSVRANSGLPADGDFNHDGKINRADVEAIAAAAVRLPGGGVQ